MKQGDLRSVRDACLAGHKKQELWPTYFERRFVEFSSYLELLRDYPARKVLELGCGLGYGAALLSQVYESVTATDLELISEANHAIGLTQTRTFLKSLGTHNVEVVGASAEVLPFPDGTFDLVFSSHVLEHVPNTDLAIREIHRVLKPGGICFSVTPTRSERSYYLFSHYLYLLKRAFVKAFESVGEKPRGESKQALLHSAGAQLRHFPFPPPHGASNHFLQEWLHWSFRSWRNIADRHPGFQVVGQFSTQLNPLLALGGIAPRFALRAHEATRRAELKLGRWPLLRSLGFNCVTISRKI